MDVDYTTPTVKELEEKLARLREQKQIKELEREIKNLEKELGDSNSDLNEMLKKFNPDDIPNIWNKPTKPGVVKFCPCSYCTGCKSSNISDIRKCTCTNGCKNWECDKL